jgi:hypothetical protein
MQNITLHVVGQRVLADILKEKEGIIKMNILFFENLSDFLENTKNNIVKSIVVTHLSNLELIRQSNSKIDNPIFFLTSNKNNISTKTKLQKYELIYCPFNLINFIEKINLAYSKYNFCD